MNMAEQPLRAVLAYCVKRFILLAAKLAGFKSCCVGLASVLLIKGYISPSVWGGIVISAVTGAVGTHVADSWRQRPEETEQEMS